MDVIKVVLLIPTLDQSGAEKQLSLLACGLPKDEFQVDVICLNRGGVYEEMLQEHGIVPTVLGKRLRFDVSTYFRLKQELQQRQPDILHTWIFAANAYGRLINRQNPRTKVLVSERCVDSWKSKWQHWLDHKLLRHTTRIVGNSNSVVQFYRERGVPEDLLVPIPNGIEIPDQQCSAAERAERLAEFDIPADAHVVGFVGRLAAQKRVDDLIWGMELLRQLDERAYFLLVGDGPDRADLEQFARSCGASERIRFTGHRSDVQKLFPTMDAFWLASDFEGQSNSIMEAMAWGLPVVATNIPENAELVVEGETGNLVPVGGRVQFAKAAEKILGDSELAKRFGEAGRQRMRTHFSVPQMVQSYAELYRQILNE